MGVQFGNEETVVLTMPLPAGGRSWRYLADCNMLVLSDLLDEEGRAQAVREVSKEWRRHHLKLVPARDAPPAA